MKLMMIGSKTLSVAHQRTKRIATSTREIAIDSKTSVLKLQAHLCWFKKTMPGQMIAMNAM
jgi:hypothetical protein